MSVRKLTTQEVKEIRELDLVRAHLKGLADVYKRDNIARLYGVSPTTIHAIVEGISYSEVE